MSEKQHLDSDLRVVEIGVRGLFGLYDHTIKLNSEERITIIHGPNGVGKTKVLEMVNHFLSFNFEILYDQYREIFKELYIVLKDGEKLSIYSSFAEEEYSLTLRFTKNDLSWSIDDKLVVIEADGLSDNQTEIISSHGTYGKWDSSDRLILYFNNVINNRSKKRFKCWHLLILSSFSLDNLFFSVNFIDVERLYKSGKDDEGDNRAVNACTAHLLSLLDESLNQYGLCASQLEQTFPHRLIKASRKDIDFDQLKKRLEAVIAQRKRYIDLSLLSENDDVSPFDIDELNNLDKSQYYVMDLYIEDAKAKLDILESLAHRIEVFLAIINRKLTNKHLTFTKREGLTIHDIREYNLPSMGLLSSGEQHEIVLIYDLLFKTEKNALVMIDEPELSLHVSWQDSFVDDLKEVIKIAQFDVILATHSPYIIGDHSNLMVALSAKQAKVIN